MQKFERKVNSDGSITFTFDFGHNVSKDQSDSFIAQVLGHRENINLTEREKIILQAKAEHWPSILLLISQNEHKKDVASLFHDFVFKNRWETVKKMVNAGVHPDLTLSLHSDSALARVLYRKGQKFAKENVELVDFFLDHGADPKLKTKRPNFGLNVCISRRASFQIFNSFLQRFLHSLNDVYNFLTVLRDVFYYPNYNKFRCLLVHGLTLDPKIVKDGLIRMKNKRKPTHFDHWRKNQHKRKIVADIKAWPLTMLIYCLQKRLIPAYYLVS